MSQITLVSHQHNDNIRIRMIPQLLQPSRHILVRLTLTYIVDKESTNGTTVVGGGDGTVTFLACCVPDLGFDSFAVDLDAAGCELDADGALAVEVEFVAGETGEEVRFSYTGVAYQNYFE